VKWIISLDKSPPGEWFIREAGKTFGPSPLPKEVAGRLADFRAGNSLPRSDPTSCLQDIIVFTVNRLGNNTEYLTNIDGTPESLTPSLAAGGGCPGCGANVT